MPALGGSPIGTAYAAPGVGGITRPGYLAPPAKPNVFSAYSGSIPQTASDYDNIMKSFGNLAASAGRTASTPISSNPINADVPSYSTSPDVKQATSGLADFAQTGGYSAGDISNIRERGISPIRAIYANANRNLQRSRSLQGGYSPGYATAQARMAREMADQISSRVTDINAGLAQSIAQNKLAGGQAYAGVAGSEADRAAGMSRFGSAAKNETNQFNERNRLSTEELNRRLLSDAWNRELEATRGQQSLYGTTPALASTFGAQALSAGNLAENQRQFDTNFQAAQLPNIAGMVLGAH